MELRMRPIPVVRWQLGGGAFQPILGARLAEGRMSAPAVQPEALAALQKAISRVLDALTVELEAVQVELDDVSPATLRVDPDRRKEISYVGGYTPQEVRTILTVSARQLGSLAERLAGGALAAYMTQDQAQIAAQLQGQAARLLAAAQNQDALPVDPGHQADVQRYLDMHLASVTAMLRDAEKGVVQAEAGSVPVLEPYEKGLSTGTVVAGIGVAAGIGLLVWLFA